MHVHGGYMVGTTYHLQVVLRCRRARPLLVHVRHRLDRRPLLHRLCAALRGRDHAVPRRRHRLSRPVASHGRSSRSYGVTKMFTAPTALRMFMRYGEAAIRRSTTSPRLRVIACAGEPLNPEAWRWAQTYLAGDGKWGYVVDNWWQTELGGPAIGHACHHADASRQSGSRAARLRSRRRRPGRQAGRRRE